jgi:hypothetical protein
MNSRFLSAWMALGVLGMAGALAIAATAAPIPNSFTVPVLVVHYFPTNGANIDLQATGDWGASIESTRAKTRRQTEEVLKALEEGSRYLAFRNPAAKPAVKYTVAGNLEFLHALTTFKKPGHRTPMTDYNQVAAEANFQDWVENKGVREVWIWGYHGGKVDLWESSPSTIGGCSLAITTWVACAA